MLQTLSRVVCVVNNPIGDGELHDRMPVIIEPHDWPTWLGEVEVDPATLLRPADDDVLKVWPVSKQVNSPRNNGAELLEAVGKTPGRATQLGVARAYRSYPTIPFHQSPIAHSGSPAARKPVMAFSNAHSDRFRLWGHARY